MAIEEILDLNQLEEAQRLYDSGSLTDYELKEIFKIALAAEDYERTHPIECYKPIPATRSGGPYQLAFHNSENLGRGLFGGNQVGKTKAGSMEVAMHFTGEYPVWFNPKNRLGINNGRILVKDFPKSVGEVIEPALLAAIPPQYIKDIKRNSKGFITRMVSITGSRFDVVTHDMDTESLEGWQGDWLWCDEPPPRDKWVSCLRGLIRKKGRWWITCTPLTQPWLYDAVFVNPKYFCLVIDISDNPYLSEEAIAEFSSRLTEEEKEARLHGKFMHLAGLTYKSFNAAIHVKSQTTVIPHEWPRKLICDPHDRRPFFLMWMAIDPLGRIWIYDEWPSGWFHEMRSSDKSVKDYFHIINEKEMGQRIYKRIMDGRACKVPKMGEDDAESLLELFDRTGIYPPFEPGYITTTTGIADPGHQKINELLRISPVTDQPSMFVLENCRNVIYAFQHNTWDDYKGPRALEAKETQSQFAKDPLDTIRYGVVDGTDWVEPADWQSQHDQQVKPKWVTEREAELHGGFGYGGNID